MEERHSRRGAIHAAPLFPVGQWAALGAASVCSRGRDSSARQPEPRASGGHVEPGAASKPRRWATGAD